MSDLFFDRQTCNKKSARRPNQTTPTIHVYQCLKGKHITWTVFCVKCAAVSLLKTPALNIEPNHRLIEDGEFVFQMFTDYVDSVVLSSTKGCKRHTNNVHPLKYEHAFSLERRS